MGRLNIWTNLKLNDSQAARFSSLITPHRLLTPSQTNASNLDPASSDRQLVDHAHVAFGQPTNDDVVDARHLRLVCLSTAGYTRYDTTPFRQACAEKEIAFCNASRVYDEPCAQHALAMILGACRQLPDACVSQLTQKGWPYLKLRGRSSVLDDRSTVLLVGYGAIARRLAELLAPFRCRTIAFRRRVRGDENCQTHPIDALDHFLPEAHHVVNILPASSDTALFFDATRIGRMKPHASFYNIGRGDTVDQPALIAALTSNALDSAYLDVTSPEPLPPDHPLWTAPRCFISPHTAGGTWDETDQQIDHFVENLQRFERGEALLDRIF